MRKHTLYLLLAGWGLLAASCYDDKSTLQTTHIPPVEIEVPEAIASQLTVVHNARLDITGIRITKDGRENPEELTYEWTVSQTDNDSEAISLATTREFHEVIDLPISSKGYLFLLTVTDTAHDLKYQYKWTLIVTAQFNEGLLRCRRRRMLSGPDPWSQRRYCRCPQERRLRRRPHRWRPA